MQKRQNNIIAVSAVKISYCYGFIIIAVRAVRMCKITQFTILIYDLLHNVRIFYFSVLCKGKHLCHDLCGFRILVYKRKEELALFAAADSKNIDLMSSELMYHTAAEMNGVGTVFSVNEGMILFQSGRF